MNDEIIITRRIEITIEITSNPLFKILDNDVINPDEEKILYNHEEVATKLSDEIIDHLIKDAEASDTHESFVIDDFCENNSVEHDEIAVFEDLVKQVKITAKEII